MDEKIREENSVNFIRELIYLTRRYIVLIIAVIIFATAGGALYSYMRTPNYTASTKVVFQAKTGENGQTTTYDINIMRAYIDTVVDFCDEGVVLDRANYYYMKWIEEKDLDPDAELSDYLENLDKVDHYDKSFDIDESYFSKGKVATKTQSSNNSTQLIFSIKYTDNNSISAQEKVRILSYAFAKEIGSKTDSNGNLLKSEYFSDLFVEIKNLGNESVSLDMSKSKILIISFVLGVVLALAIVVVLYYADNTIKSKEELEKLSGVKVFGCVENNGGRKNGK